MSATDRLLGALSSLAFKAPVRVATTANITLSALQTIDGVALAADDRVLVKNQTDQTENGIYAVDTSGWERTPDCDGNSDLVNGTIVYIRAGSTQAGVFAVCTATDPITIGTTNITWAATVALPVTVSAYWATVLDEATAALARNMLGLTNQTLWCGTATGTADALILTPSVAAEALVAGLDLIFKSSASANTAATTIAVSGLAATAVQSNGVACVGGEIEASKWYRAIYDGAAFQLSRVAPAILLELVTAKGDLIAGTADQKVARVALGAAGSVPISQAAATTGLAYAAAVNKAIYGFTYSNNAGDATNDIDIAAGGAMDATGAYWITVAALTKQSDAAWAVGNNAGALDTGAVGNSDYYIWAIARSDTGITDYLFSLSSTAPSMPTGYDFKRLIGWFKRLGGTIVAFNTYETEGGGIEMKWTSPTLDVNLASTLTTSRRTDAVKVPLNFATISLLRVHVADNTSAFSAIICCPDETDVAASAGNAPGVSIISPAASASGYAMEMQIRTSAAGLIAARAGIATVDIYDVATLGFTWARRN